MKIGRPIEKSDGSGDERFPMCSGPSCWCYNCSMDSMAETDDEGNEKELEIPLRESI